MTVSPSSTVCAEPASALGASLSALTLTVTVSTDVLVPSETLSSKVMVEFDCPDCEGTRLKAARRLVRIGGKKIAVISQPDEYFGEMSAITGEPRSASIVSEGRSFVIRYPGDKLPETMEKNPEVAQALFKTFAKRLGETNSTLVKMKAERDKLMYYIHKKKPQPTTSA